MSADNYVVILATEDEHRVAHVQGLENMYYPWGDPDPDWILEAFGPSEVFTDYHKAYDAAEKLENEIGYVEYGMHYADDFIHFSFQDLIEGRVAKRLILLPVGETVKVS